MESSPSPIEYHVYSDVSGFSAISRRSGNHNRFGYAYVVVDNCKEIVFEKAGIVVADTVNLAEIQAMLLALKEIPNGANVVAHSDIAGIKNYIDNKLNNQTFNQFKSATSRINCTFKYDDKRYRSWFYTCCHRAARKARHYQNVKPSDCTEKESDEIS